ncbi:MAG TPA: metalloregulator ArsR/SmtB family transcription factor, partial [Steroidobacteraceae bacterium]|nr:metalloregulator ArsR/SmtB family transcription factor [Steroidobacteraceae bacterium]
RALGDPTRLWFVECLLDSEARLSEFYGIFPITLPTVMHHIRVLEQAGLVCTEKQGTVRMCRIRAEGFEEAEKWLRLTSCKGYARQCDPGHAGLGASSAEDRLPRLHQFVLPARKSATSASSDTTGAEQVLPRQR